MPMPGTPAISMRRGSDVTNTSLGGAIGVERSRLIWACDGRRRARNAAAGSAVATRKPRRSKDSAIRTLWEEDAGSTRSAEPTLELSRFLTPSSRTFGGAHADVSLVDTDAPRDHRDDRQRHERDVRHELYPPAHGDCRSPPRDHWYDYERHHHPDGGSIHRRNADDASRRGDLTPQSRPHDDEGQEHGGPGEGDAEV